MTTNLDLDALNDRAYHWHGRVMLQPGDYDELLRMARENRQLKIDVDDHAKRYAWLKREAYEVVIPHGETINGKRTAWCTKLYQGADFDAAMQEKV